MSTTKNFFFKLHLAGILVAFLPWIFAIAGSNTDSGNEIDSFFSNSFGFTSFVVTEICYQLYNSAVFFYRYSKGMTTLFMLSCAILPIIMTLVALCDINGLGFLAILVESTSLTLLFVLAHAWYAVKDYRASKDGNEPAIQDDVQEENDEEAE